MTHAPLRVSIGQHSEKGRKESNQDFHGALVPREPLATLKGIAVALADGISSSSVSGEASRAAVGSFLEDYYCTSEAWSVKTSVERVMSAANSWLHAQTQSSPYRYEKDRGYVCTFSALVLKGAVAHVFHVGDTRVYRVSHAALEQLTIDHRVRASAEESYLSRALGATTHLELEYRAVPLEVGGTFLLATDGVYEYASDQQMTELIARHEADLDLAARRIVEAAYENGSPDNLSAQIVRVEALPNQDSAQILLDLSELPLPPLLEPRMHFDGYTITRALHASHRSHVYLAVDDDTQELTTLKIPAIDLRAESALLERFLMEEWVARRIDNAHVLSPRRQTRRRNFLYLAAEYVEGQTLTQWMIDHPQPSVEAVRQIVEQIGRGLNAFHKLEMLHQDLQPDNIMIDHAGTVKIIDFGSVHVAGVAELANDICGPEVLGKMQYTAPEYFIGEVASTRSDLFSLGVITYQMLSGRLPYGGDVPKRRSKRAQRQLVYRSVLHSDREIPAWIDDTLRRAVHPDPAKRYSAASEFVFDLRHPRRGLPTRVRAPLLESDPARFWKSVSALLALIIALLLLRSCSRGSSPAPPHGRAHGTRGGQTI